MKDCPINRCINTIRDNKVMCGQCWAALPDHIRSRITQAFTQHRDGLIDTFELRLAREQLIESANRYFEDGSRIAKTVRCTCRKDVFVCGKFRLEVATVATRVDQMFVIIGGSAESAIGKSKSYTRFIEHSCEKSS